MRCPIMPTLLSGVYIKESVVCLIFGIDSLKTMSSDSLPGA